MPTFAQQAQFKAEMIINLKSGIDLIETCLVTSVNSGVILFDNKKWIDNDMTSKFIEVVKDERISSKFVVQGYLNYFGGKFDYLEKEFNKFLK